MKWIVLVFLCASCVVRESSCCCPPAIPDSVTIRMLKERAIADRMRDSIFEAEVDRINKEKFLLNEWIISQKKYMARQRRKINDLIRRSEEISLMIKSRQPKHLYRARSYKLTTMQIITG